MKKVSVFIRSHIVFFIATVCALTTCFIIPPDKEYINYIDFKTLCCLFSTLCVVCALKNIRFFTFVARRIIKTAINLRICILLLICITFVGSLFIANDMALITFLPLGYIILKETENEKYMAYVFVLQNISANLGGMLTPFGNPQNLYLYSKYGIDNLEFIKVMFPPFALSVLLLTLITMFFPSSKMQINNDERIEINPKRAVIYLVLFAVSILAVFSLIPYYIAAVTVIVSFAFLDRKALKSVDYFLLSTFFMFFVFAGNMSRIEVVKNFFSGLLDKNTLVFSALSCQFISNVPSAILLSQFTDNWKSLLLGVNIGGTGTLIASLASLITFSEFSRYCPDKKGRYLRVFGLLNLLFLSVLLLFCVAIRKYL